MTQMSDEQFEKLQEMLAPKAQAAARTEDAVLRLGTYYNAGLDIIGKVVRQLGNDGYMESEDYACCPHCGGRILS